VPKIMPTGFNILFRMDFEYFEPLRIRYYDR